LHNLHFSNFRIKQRLILFLIYTPFINSLDGSSRNNIYLVFIFYFNLKLRRRGSRTKMKHRAELEGEAKINIFKIYWTLFSWFNVQASKGGTNFWDVIGYFHILITNMEAKQIYIYIFKPNSEQYKNIVSICSVQLIVGHQLNTPGPQAWD
jgi:hypothetical protein